jgi:hypothetical protein
MKKLGILGTLVFWAVLFTFAGAEGPKFQVVFVVEPGDVSNEWLDSIKTSWGATGVALKIFWGEVEATQGVYDWRDVDSDINSIVAKGLDVYVRINMGRRKPTWVNPQSRGSKYFQIIILTTSILLSIQGMNINSISRISIPEI